MLIINDDVDVLREQCRALVLRRASLCAGVAALPIPGVDVATDVAVLMQLLPEINRKFGLSSQQIDRLDPETKKFVLMLATSVGSELIARVITKELVFLALKKVGWKLAAGTVAKFVPLAGQVLCASVSFAALRMLGNAHVEDCYRVARLARVDVSRSGE